MKNEFRCPIGEIARFKGDVKTLQEAALNAKEQARRDEAREEFLFERLGIYSGGKNWRGKGPHQMEEVPEEEAVQIREEIQAIRQRREFFGET